MGLTTVETITRSAYYSVSLVVSLSLAYLPALLDLPAAVLPPPPDLDLLISTRSRESGTKVVVRGI